MWKTPSLLWQKTVSHIISHVTSQHKLYAQSTVQCTKELAFRLSVFAQFLQESVSVADWRHKLKALSIFFYFFWKFLKERQPTSSWMKISSWVHVFPLQVEVLDLKITDCTKCCNNALNPFKTILLVFLQSLLFMSDHLIWFFFSL